LLFHGHSASPEGESILFLLDKQIKCRSLADPPMQIRGTIVANPLNGLVPFLACSYPSRAWKPYSYPLPS
jgi:hypothetical protein